MRVATILITAIVALLCWSTVAHADDTLSIPISRGVEHVRNEVAGVEATGSSRLPREQIAAQSALTFVQGRLSPAIYALSGGSSDLETAFRLQAGLCGDIVEAFLQIMEHVGVRALPVQWFYTVDGVRQNHVAAQVWWRGRWHYVDPTWGLLFERKGQVLSPQQVIKLEHPQRHAVMNRLVPWTYANERRGGGWRPLSYLTDATERQVILDGQGTVRAPRTATGTTAAWDLALMPDYVGTYLPYAHTLVGVRHRLTLPAGSRTLTITGRGKLCGGPGVLHVGPVDVPFAEVPDAGDLTVRLPKAGATITLWADGGDAAEPCAVLLSGLRAA